jgi:hypothetical protein
MILTFFSIDFDFSSNDMNLCSISIPSLQYSHKKLPWITDVSIIVTVSESSAVRIYAINGRLGSPCLFRASFIGMGRAGTAQRE